MLILANSCVEQTFLQEQSYCHLPPPIPSNAANLTPWTKSNFLAVTRPIDHDLRRVQKRRPLAPGRSSSDQVIGFRESPVTLRFIDSLRDHGVTNTRKPYSSVDCVDLVLMNKRRPKQDSQDQLPFLVVSSYVTACCPFHHV